MPINLLQAKNSIRFKSHWIVIEWANKRRWHL